jgi:hypothetical protein
MSGAFTTLVLSSMTFSLPVAGSISTFLAVTSCSTTRNSTRRFFSRPSSVSLGAIGFSMPHPRAVRRAASTPSFFTMWAMTDLARSSESFLLSLASPSALACPSIEIFFT